MKKLIKFVPVVLTLFLISACSLLPQTIANSSGEQPTAVIQTEAPTAAHEVTMEMLRNLTYTLPASNKTVQLTDGKYDLTNGNDILHVGMADISAFGDLNGDGLADAVVIIGENTGGSGSFISLVAVINQDGTPVQAGAVMLGDRVQVNSLAIAGQKITLDEVIHGPNDPACCPTVPETATYMLTQSGLFLTHVTTKTSTGSLRDLTIESPTFGATVSTSVEVKGSFTIGPFENTLSCQVVGTDGNVFSQTPIMVNNAEMGAPGTFSAGIDFSAVPAGQKFFVVISDLSAADGSILTLDAVQLLRQ